MTLRAKDRMLLQCPAGHQTSRFVESLRLALRGKWTLAPCRECARLERMRWRASTPKRRVGFGNLCAKYGLKTATVARRIRVGGMSLKQALAKPVRPVKNVGLVAAAARAGVTKNVLAARLRMGWSKHRALRTPILKRGTWNKCKLSPQLVARAHRNGISIDTLRYRLRKGLSRQRATAKKTIRSSAVVQREIAKARVARQLRRARSLKSSALRAGLNPSAVYERIRTLGWSRTRALTTPIAHRTNTGQYDKRRKAS